MALRSGQAGHNTGKLASRAAGNGEANLIRMSQVLMYVALLEYETVGKRRRTTIVCPSRL